jgi:hypothetical protein
MEKEMSEFAEHRGGHRATINMPGRVVLADLTGARDVIIRDLSVHGANLCLNDDMLLPAEFYLLIRSRYNPERIRRTCVKRWQIGWVVGVRFADVLPAADFDEIVVDGTLPIPANDMPVPTRFAAGGRR